MICKYSLAWSLVICASSVSLWEKKASIIFFLSYNSVFLVGRGYHLWVCSQYLYLVKLEHHPPFLQQQKFPIWSWTLRKFNFEPPPHTHTLTQTHTVKEKANYFFLKSLEDKDLKENRIQQQKIELPHNPLPPLLLRIRILRIWGIIFFYMFVKISNKFVPPSKSDAECLHVQTLYGELSLPVTSYRIAHSRVGECVIVWFSKRILTIQFYTNHPLLFTLANVW